MDQTEDGRRLIKMMPVVDEYTRECLTVEVQRSITAEDGGCHPNVLVRGTGRAVLHPLGQWPGIRSGGGQALALGACGVKTLYIEPGSPWENAYYSETFIGRFGDELLKRELFTTVLEAKVLVAEYRAHYNCERPHSALGYRTPAEFAASCEPGGADEDLRKELGSVSTLS